MSEKKAYLQEMIGNLYEIKTEQNDLLVVARIESVDPEDDSRITVVAANEDERLPLVAYNTPVKIVSFAGSQGFLLLRANVYISTTSILTLVNVDTAQGFDRRKYFRLNTNVPATAVLQHEGATEEELDANVMPLTVYDISLGGIRIDSQRVLNAGDLLLTSFQLLDKKMEFCCKVCREIPAKRPTPGHKQYGCEFVSFSNRQIDQLCNVLFKMQRIQIQNRKKNRYD